MVKKIDKNGRILILDIKVDEANFDKTYNPNTETEQVATLHDLDKMLETIKDLYDKHKGKLKGKLDLCDIWRIREHKTEHKFNSR